MWYNKWDFTDNPYGIKTTEFIPYDKIVWNRDDLKDKPNIENFIQDILDQRSTSLRIFGPTRSGKTWLLRYIEKSLFEKLGEEVIIIKTSATDPTPTLNSLYEEFIESVNKQQALFLSKVEETIGKTPEEWREFFDDPELGKAFWNIKYEQNKDESYQWLKGVNLTATSLCEAGLVSNIKGNKMIEIITKIIGISTSLYKSCILMVDEIGQVRPASQARVVGGTLRQILDSFFEKFGLVCTYTAHLSDHLIDLGYSEHLYRRFEYECELTPIHGDFVNEFIKLHHHVYREPTEDNRRRINSF